MQPFDLSTQSNIDYIEQLYQQYRKDPGSVSEVWRAYFAGFELAGGRTPAPLSAIPGTDGEAVVPPAIGVFDLVHSYRELGHFSANIDPLGTPRPLHPLLTLYNFDLDDSYLDRHIGKGGFLGETDGTLRDLINKLQQTYNGTLGIEYTGISDKTQREWLQHRIEPALGRPRLSPEETRNLMFQLIAAEEFELYLGRAFLGQKRFRIEGAVIGGEKFMMSMAHRGRLNALAHVLNKPYEVILSEFMYTALPMKDVPGDGDVKYHLGYANQRPIHRNGVDHNVKVSLVPNPSHLELINPIMQGITRCQQQYTGDTQRRKVVPINVHGDAAFTGQGVVAETLYLSELAGFSTGGTVHIIVNNQIGFTTPPRQGRFTPYPTDIAKAIQAPIFHVNGDDPEAAVFAARLAIGFRQEFRCDVMLDLWCYRRNGRRSPSRSCTARSPDTRACANSTRGVCSMKAASRKPNSTR
ncbi:MAG TPA: thiamine pyrophosphate-dependent enzyme [Tepidisphaeraceae bacterium]|nr:thiamine pyrophosphate-dependent enzyme [Tepidisphaeraceae bacterium]